MRWRALLALGGSPATAGAGLGLGGGPLGVRVALGLALELALDILGGVHVEVVCVAGNDGWDSELVFKGCERCVVDKGLLFGEDGEDFSALALAAEKLGVVGGRKLNEPGEVLLCVKLKQGFKGR